MRVVSVAFAATAVTPTTNLAVGALGGILRNAALERDITGLALTLSGPLLHPILGGGFEGLVVFRVKTECSLRLDLCLEAGIEGEVVLAFSDRSAYLWT
jgi:hypothetical protein